MTDTYISSLYMSPTGTTEAPECFMSAEAQVPTIRFRDDRTLASLHITLGQHQDPVAWLRKFSSRLALLAAEVEAARDVAVLREALESGARGQR